MFVHSCGALLGTPPLARQPPTRSLEVSVYCDEDEVVEIGRIGTSSSSFIRRSRCDGIVHHAMDRLCGTGRAVSESWPLSKSVLLTREDAIIKSYSWYSWTTSKVRTPLNVP